MSELEEYRKLGEMFGCPPKSVQELGEELRQLRELAQALGSPPKSHEELVSTVGAIK